MFDTMQILEFGVLNRKSFHHRGISFRTTARRIAQRVAGENDETTVTTTTGQTGGGSQQQLSFCKSHNC